MVQRKVFGSDVNIEIKDSAFPSEAEIDGLEQHLPTCNHGWFESSYGKAKLHYRSWIPEGKVKGVAVFFHGIMSNSGQGLVLDGQKLGMALVSEAFLKHGIALYSFDAYGHGFSEGKRFWIPKTWENNLKDCIVFAKMASEKHPDPPLFIIGESYGGCLAIHTARHFQDHEEECPKFDSLLLSAPAIEADLPPFPVFQVLKYGLAPLFPTRTPFFMPNPVTADRVWRNKEVLARFTDPDYKKFGLDARGSKMRLGTALGCVLAVEAAKDKAIPGFKVPFCIFHGTADASVKIEGSQYMFKTASTPEGDKELHAIEGSFHECLVDPELAEECCGHWLNFIEKRLKQ
eukprot:scaffold1736_cov127-Cylindrotheca_fusiformis.AAC.56